MDFTAIKAIGDETRFKIIRLLVNHDQCVSGLSRKIGISESAISQHLKVLKEANMVTSEKDGYFTKYSLNRDLLKVIGSELVKLAEREPIKRAHFERRGKHCQRGKR